MSDLPSADVGVVDGLPATTVARTILDVAGTARPRTLEQVIASAERLALVDRRTLLERLERAGPIRGARLLRSILDAATDRAFTRSVAEERLLDLVRLAGLPEPRLNVRVGNFELDFLWPEDGVAVEVDGFAYHSSRRAFERDRDRDFDLATRGVQILRVTWRQLEGAPYVVIRRLARASGGRPGRGSEGLTGGLPGQGRAPLAQGRRRGRPPWRRVRGGVGAETDHSAAASPRVVTSTAHSAAR